MKLVMTLLVRDEADIVDAQIAFHLNAGVDFIVATDNRSVDGTTEILESYARDGVLSVIHEPGAAYEQNAWLTRMAGVAAREFGADWIIHSDADEFWWPRGKSLKTVLEEIPDRYGVVKGLWRHFVPRSGDSPFFAERMTVRVAPRVAMTNPASPYATEAKTAHRADPRVVVGGKGAYTAGGRALQQLRGWYPIEVLHFPMRDRAQCARKYRHLSEGYSRAHRGAVPLYELVASRLTQAESGQELSESYYDSQIIDEATLSRGLEDGSLAIDTRLRDALRAIRVEGGTHPFASPSGGDVHLRFSRPDIVDEIGYAAEAALLDEADVIRFQTRLDRLEAELNRLRLTRRAKLRWKLAHLARRG